MDEIKKGNDRAANDELQIKNQNASIKNLKMQLGQIHNILAQRTQGTLPLDTKNNLREHVNTISLRSGTTYEGPKQKKLKK